MKRDAILSYTLTNLNNGIYKISNYLPYFKNIYNFVKRNKKSINNNTKKR